MRKFIIQCKNVKCKKPILKANPVIKKVTGGFTYKGDQALISLSAVDVLTGEPVVMPNVWCRHCKEKNVFTEEDVIFTDKLDDKAKAELNEKVKAELQTFKKANKPVKNTDDIFTDADLDKIDNF